MYRKVLLYGVFYFSGFAETMMKQRENGANINLAHLQIKMNYLCKEKKFYAAIFSKH